MHHNIFNFNSNFRIYLKHSLSKISCLDTDILPIKLLKFNLTFHIITNNLFVITTSKWRLS